MAEEKKTGTAKAEKAEKKAVTVKAAEDTYPVEELAAASRKVFQAPPEVAVAALKALNKKEMTVAEARAAITSFLKKEVK